MDCDGQATTANTKLYNLIQGVSNPKLMPWRGEEGARGREEKAISHVLNKLIVTGGTSTSDWKKPTPYKYAQRLTVNHAGHPLEVSVEADSTGGKNVVSV